jgi:hypothetical protein
MAQSKFDHELEASLDSLAVGVGRFLAGQDLDGTRRTDATFFRPGRRVLPKVDDRVPRSAYRAGWQRLAGRLATLSAIGGTGYAYWQDPAATVTGLEAGGTGAAGLTVASALAYAVLGRQRRELMREWIDPLHQALTGPLGIPEQTHPRRYLHIPRDFSDDDAVIRIDLPVSLRFNQELVADLITKKLALEGVSMSWNLAGRAPHVLVRKSHRPPNTFAFTGPGARQLVAKAPESAPLIGLGGGRAGVAVDLDAESPHVLVSAGTGGGKSVILRTIACQLLHHGALVYVLDFKRISHLWARGVPGATYCRDIAEIHDALLHLGAEGRRRIRLADQLSNDPDADPADVGPRLAILLEEVNATMKQLARYWERIRQSGDPKTSPAIDALAEILFMGRQVRLHVLLVAQSATARALGGPEMREQFATRILARYTQNAWRMLAPEITPAPKSTRHIGRAQVVLGSVAHETQVLFFTDEQARAWATSGTTPPTDTALHDQAPAFHTPIPVSGPPAVPAADDPSTWTAEDQAAAAAPPTVPDDQAVGLRQAQRDHLPGLTLAALRWARANDPDFPAPVNKRGAELLYRIGELQRWARNRPRAGAPQEDPEES